MILTVNNIYLIYILRFNNLYSIAIRKLNIFLLQILLYESQLIVKYKRGKC